MRRQGRAGNPAFEPPRCGPCGNIEFVPAKTAPPAWVCPGCNAWVQRRVVPQEGDAK